MAFFQSLQNSAFTDWFLGSSSIWTYPTVLTLHTVGLAMLVGAVALLPFGLKGALAALPFAVWLFLAIEQLRAGYGEAIVLEANLVEGLNDHELQALFDGARDEEYARIASEAREVTARLATETEDGALAELAQGYGLVLPAWLTRT